MNHRKDGILTVYLTEECTLCLIITNLSADKNISVWRIYITQIVFPVFSTRVMYWPVITFGAIEIIVNPKPARGIIHWAIVIARVTCNELSRCWGTLTCACYSFDHLAKYTSAFPINQTSYSWITSQPIVYVALYKDLFAKVFPQRKV